MNPEENPDHPEYTLEGMDQSRKVERLHQAQ
jgi:hypothetical protein